MMQRRGKMHAYRGQHARRRIWGRKASAQISDKRLADKRRSTREFGRVQRASRANGANVKEFFPTPLSGAIRKVGRCSAFTLKTFPPAPYDQQTQEDKSRINAEKLRNKVGAPLCIRLTCTDYRFGDYKDVVPLGVLQEANSHERYNNAERGARSLINSGRSNKFQPSSAH